MINLYHAGYLPEGIDRSKLHRWPFVYLHGAIEADDFKVDAPDIFLADIELEKIDDGVTECQIHMGAKITRVEAYIWSHASEVAYRKGVFAVVNVRRMGLVVSSENMDDWTYAYNKWSNRYLTV